LGIDKKLFFQIAITLIKWITYNNKINLTNGKKYGILIVGRKGVYDMRRKKFTSKSKSKKNSKQLRDYIKKRKKVLGISKCRHFIKMTCIKCKREFKIRVNDKSIYTKEMIQNYICLLCRPIKRR
jgi:hypothetical protein